VSRCRKSLFRSSLTLSSWLHVRDLEHLSPKQITEFLSGAHRRTSGDLKEGYEIAQDPTEWEKEIKELEKEKEKADNQVDELEDDDEEADVSATKRKKATKEKSKKKAKISKVSLIVFVSSGLGQDGFGQIS
jgi:hypothetical protein